jgi:PAS domain S-box-containing protein
MPSALARSTIPIQSSCASWKQTLEEMGEIFWEWEIRTGQTLYSENVSQLLGNADESISTDELPITKLIHPEDKAVVEEILAEILLGERAFFSFACRMVCANGEARWILLRGKSTMPSPNWADLRLIGTIRDVHEEKTAQLKVRDRLAQLEAKLNLVSPESIEHDDPTQIESLLRQSETKLAQKEELLEMAVEIAKVGWWETDLEQSQTYWSPATCRIFELDPPVTPPMEEHARFFTPEHLQIIQRTIQVSIENRTAFELELPANTAKGRAIWVKTHGQVVLENGTPVKLLGAIQDITAQKENENTLRQTMDRLSLACTAGGIGIWELVKPSDTMIWDDQMFALYGLKRGDFIGTYQALISAMHPDDRARCESEFAAVVQDGQTFNTEYRVVWPDGSVHHIRASAKIIRDEQGQALNMVGTNWDITDRKAAEAELEKAKIKAIASSRAKAEFLASMSHEIRTPMNGVLGITQLLADTKLSEEQQEMVRTIQTSGDALLTILNDILDFSKIEAGKLQIEKVPFDLTQTMGHIVELLSITAKKKGFSIQLEYDVNLPSRIVSDPSRIRQVLFNLLGNAVKFTSHGGVTVKATRQKERLLIAIRDTGIGIPEDKQGLMFQTFTQANASTSRKFGGTGLGLAISKRLMELMGGDIGFTSQVGMGSEFWIDLPLVVAPNVVQAPIQSSTQEKFPSWTAVTDAIATHHVLLVEDNLVNQKVAMGMLKKMKCRYDLAENGFQAVEKAFSENYTLILMDCEMPEMDGYEATREIRRREAQRPWVQNRPEHRVIMALTANAMKEDELRCMACGMDGFLSKPLKMRDLTHALASKIRIKA